MPSEPVRDPYFPWDHLGLRANPFQSLTRNDWAQIAILPLRLEPWLERPSTVLQVTGDKGSGKTSTLLALERIYSQRNLEVLNIYLQRDAQLPPIELNNVDILILDEAQRLQSRVQAQLFQKIQMKSLQTDRNPLLLLSTHRDLSLIMKRNSLENVQIDLMRLEAEDLAQMLAKRVRYFTRAGQQPRVRFEPESIEFLLNTFGPDLRRLEAFLYHFFQAIPEDPSIKLEALEIEVELRQTGLDHNRG